ncbi:MAG: 2-hydroxyacyl-CoA dehydratase [Desulfarculus sp.]|jgi:benzoyl-CoA reductase/2-hydroxyglutaryl-CoA dehydratase subunit BcrC/BadD/HgdB|nr:MAG: 2-hydroxyacyl-CoA dehydratase [Desulfarculus sp.]
MPNLKGFQFKTYDFSKRLDTKVDLIEVINNTVAKAFRNQPEPVRWIFEPLLQYIDELNYCREHPDKVVYRHFTFAPEMVYAMDCVSFVPEALTFIMPTEYLCALVDEGREMGMPDHWCGFLGGVLAPIMYGRLPQPKAILHCNQPCDNSVAQGTVLAESYPDTEMFILDNPYTDDEAGVQFCAEQLREGFKYLERMTGQKLDLDRFRQVMKNSARAYELIYQINEYKKAVPCPIPTSVILRTTSGAFYGLTGTGGLVQWLEKHLADAKMRYEKGIGGFRQEKLRVVWNLSWPVFDYSVYDWMEEAFGAIAVAYHSAEPFYQPPPDLDYSKASFEVLLRELALRNNNHAMGRQGRGHMMTFVDDSLKWCREFKADAGIFAGHWQCQANWAAAQLTKEKLMEELGIPMLVMVVDQLDPRVVSAEQMASRMEPFLEMVTAKKEGSVQ